MPVTWDPRDRLAEEVVRRIVAENTAATATCPRPGRPRCAQALTGRVALTKVTYGSPINTANP